MGRPGERVRVRQGRVHRPHPGGFRLGSVEEGPDDLYVADAETGQVLRKLTSTAADPHFDSLQFINSAGTWAPDATRLACAALRRGEPVLAIVDTATGDRVREIAIPGVDEVYHPAWSPDGRTIVVSGLAGGLSDLFLCDVESGKIDRLTHDAFADLHPAWSPDGTMLAFTTDRFGSDLDQLSFAPYQLARMDLATRRLDRIPAFPGTRSSHPQWSADGRSVYFLATAGGVPDVYRVDLGRDAPVPVTQVPTGVSGIARCPGLPPIRSAGRSGSRSLATCGACRSSRRS